ncbi:CDP-alcohol phosphatidyltransferase family protein [Nocardiopsis baichengensis]|uniref:CDP-alcohol phosphatidyltransferase family protein n=1 Tax=Nocardiopsis baichengensis TaxID=280240 RepID=UPI0003632003
MYLVDPLASRMVRAVANRSSITPDHLTIGALLLGLGAAWSFSRGDSIGLVVGAVVFHVSFLLDCMDGKIARLKGNGTVFGSWLDYVFDRVRVLICTIGLMWGQYASTGDAVFVWFALAVVFTDMFRYLNSPQMAKVRKKMRRSQKSRIKYALMELGVEESRIQQAIGEKRFSELCPRIVADVDAGGDGDGEAEGRDIEEHQEQARKQYPSGSLAERFVFYARFREFLLRHRVRPHLFSGIEFQMGVFIVAPLVGTLFPVAMLWIIGASCAGLLLFEAFIVTRLWQATRRYEREKRALDELIMNAPVPTAEEAGR